MAILLQDLSPLVGDIERRKETSKLPLGQHNKMPTKDRNVNKSKATLRISNSNLNLDPRFNSN